MRYEFEDQDFYTGQKATSWWRVRFAALSRRTWIPRGETTGPYWDYSYSSSFSTSPGTYPGDVVTVDRPDGLQDKFTYHAFGQLDCTIDPTSGVPPSSDVYLVGRPKKFEFGVSGGTALETREWTWSVSEANLAPTGYLYSPEYVVANLEDWCYQAGPIKMPQLREYKVTRDGVTYTTKNPVTGFDLYNQQIVRKETSSIGSVTRTHTMEYDAETSLTAHPVEAPDPWFIGFVTSHEEEDPNGRLTRTYQYESNGNLRTKTVGGVVVEEKNYDSQGRFNACRGRGWCLGEPRVSVFGWVRSPREVEDPNLFQWHVRG